VAVGVIGHGGLGGGDRGDAVSDGGMIVDSAMDFRQAVFGTSAPPEILERLSLLDVRYAGFDGRLHAGQLVLHRDLAAEIGDIFALMEVLKFPVAGVVPIVRYGWSDNASMADDNSSAFNYRTIAGTDRLSRHAPGRAVDRPGSPGIFTDDHPVVCAFIERGWRWGGHFDHMRDYHHFEKPGHKTKENNRGSVPI
jgi:peptidoglycan L-alanyl-D-glutamate endopeptidase CwlK